MSTLTLPTTTYVESHEALTEAQRTGANVVVTINEGTFTFTADEALDGFDNIAPGEPFIVEELVA